MEAKEFCVDGRVKSKTDNTDDINCYRCQQSGHTKNNCPVPQKGIHCSKCGCRDHNTNPSFRGGKEKQTLEKNKSPKRTPPPSPRTGRKPQGDNSRSGRSNIRVNRSIVSTAEKEDSAYDYDDDDYRPRSETPSLEFGSKDEYEDDGGDDSINVLCFRVVVA